MSVLPTSPWYSRVAVRWLLLPVGLAYQYSHSIPRIVPLFLLSAALHSVKDDHFLQLCLYAVFSTPWIELIGLCLGLGTTWYLRRKADSRGHANGEDVGGGGKRVALPERVARGLPVLVTTG